MFFFFLRKWGLLYVFDTCWIKRHMPTLEFNVFILLMMNGVFFSVFFLHVRFHMDCGVFGPCVSQNVGNYIVWSSSDFYVNSL